MLDLVPGAKPCRVQCKKNRAYKLAPVKANPVNALIPTCGSGQGVNNISRGQNAFKSQCYRRVLNDSVRQYKEAPMLEIVAADS
jgi:hypothetical protein